MPNVSYAREWLQLAKRNLETARLLLREDHFTDSIAIELQQTIEKTFKAIAEKLFKQIDAFIDHHSPMP